MKNRILYLLFLSLPAQLVSAQANTDPSNYFVYGILAIAVILFLGLVVQVSDNLLNIEAKRLGAEETGANFSIFPRLNELFAPQAPAYANGAPFAMIRRGFDILLEGEAEKTIDTSIQANTFALQPANFIGMSPIPKVEVEPGQNVKAGDVLFYDKKRPEVKYVAPVSGEVIAVNRGEKRSIKEVVILADKNIQYRAIPAFDLENATREALVEFLQEYGGWALINQRPFDVIPDKDDLPRDIFISTFDTAPLAPDMGLAVKGRGAAFQRGLDVLGKLTEGKVYLGLDARGEVPPSEVFTKATGVEKVWFKGKHPAGNVGIQIHHIRPITPNDKVWTLTVQDVITLGALFTEQRFNAERVVALTGAELKKPVYVRTYLGANIGNLLKNNLANNHVRMISGDVLSGAQKTAEEFLNFRDDQVTVIEEGDDYEMFGWLKPRFVPSASRALPSFLFPDTHFKPNTNTNGEHRAFVVTGQYESVLPMDIYPQHLFKAIVTNDFEKMEGLGIHELSEEDVALCEFVCTSKQPLQAILREGLEIIREQS
ncbi:MAG TPA: Na(+)-translocating NADH-quinone reductase subunit A [Saprospiraceae bacterium]|nr:Na(+)-translocating NADH-quinone reductase subunit A [Saprospiraceae bacterium]HMP25363.1 Na(+)-translocating NADH-quinone reductase subunit A [Saprospiraceae bacterium]